MPRGRVVQLQRMKTRQSGLLSQADQREYLSVKASLVLA